MTEGKSRITSSARGSVKCEKKSRSGKGIETVDRRKEATKVMKEEHLES